MEASSRRDAAPQGIAAALLGAAARQAVRFAGDGAGDPAGAIDASVAALARVAGVMPAVFVLEHGRLWLVAQRGYAVVPDGVGIERGIMGRAIRQGHPEVVVDVDADRDYLPARPGVVSELVVPLRSGRRLVGALNVESERLLPPDAALAVDPLARVLGELVGKLRAQQTLDLAALARLFVNLGGLRNPEDIAELAAVSISRVLPIETSHVVVWDETGVSRELASWRDGGDPSGELTAEEIEAARDRVDPTAVCEVVELGDDGVPGRKVVWLPLRANGSDLGALVAGTTSVAHVDPAVLDTAAVLAAHVGVSLDAALALRRERHSAASDPLTGILNRRGLEERLEEELSRSQALRAPLSVLVFDCDDFKEINDRAGHEFGDTILQEIADALSRAIPADAVASRIGGDEFVVVLPGSDAEAAEELGGEIRALLGEGLTAAGFPVRMSAGTATYPFDGAAPSVLLRAADQALYVAKSGGKNRVASFRDVANRAAVGPASRRAAPGEAGREGRADGDASMLADAIAAIHAIDAETSSAGVLDRLCKTLVFVVGATACSASRVVGDLVVDATEHALREVRLGDHASYRIADFPATAEVLRSGRPHTMSFADRDVDPAEAFVLRDLGMNALLMLPVVVDGRPWGLVELYEMRLRAFEDDEVVVAQFLVHQAERRLSTLDDLGTAEPKPRVYELPSGETDRGPRTR